MHIGEKIREIIALKHYTVTRLANEIGIRGSSASYLFNRKTIDVNTLASIANVLKYNFFKHYPVAEDNMDDIPGNTELAELRSRLEETTKELEASKRDLQMQQKENGYLKQINDLLQKKK